MPEARGRGKGSYRSMGTEIQLCEIRRIQEMDGGRGWRTVYVYLMPPDLKVIKM